MQVEFKFAIGEFVASRAEIESLKCRGQAVGSEFRWAASAEFRRFVVYQVSERIAQECPGGVQIKYAVSAGNLLPGAAIILEGQLMPLSEALAAIDKILDSIKKIEVTWTAGVDATPTGGDNAKT